ncbi:unnamed protein product [Rangifer tarandus platyrhynchus]|uniref:Uncharacterized protein n=2 Tax=Rangifer tarandus platyrhynchus TaxID=3082113 RepID=A0AC60A4W7_RANTA|nr:unnamed protein product [Rangifer tarandus platyrhynchus]
MQPLKGPAQPPLSPSALPPRPAGHPFDEASRVDLAPPNPAQAGDPEALPPTGSQAGAPVPPAHPCRDTPPCLIVPCGLSNCKAAQASRVTSVLELGWHKQGPPAGTGQCARPPKRRLWARGSVSKGARQGGP